MTGTRRGRVLRRSAQDGHTGTQSLTIICAVAASLALLPRIGFTQEQAGTKSTTRSARTSHIRAANADSTEVDNAKPENNSPFGAFENNSNRGPINIQSDSLALDYKNNAVLFSGKVHAVQADGQLTSNTLNVKYGKDFHVVQQMIADGGVQVRQGLRWCSADHMVMDEAAHTAVLTGTPICHDANDQISGTKITVHTDSGMSEVEGGVKALIFPHEEKTRDNRPTAQKN